MANRKAGRKIIEGFLLVVFVLVSMGTTMAGKYFDNEEELRKAMPQHYFFDFDLPEMEFSSARSSSNESVKFGCFYRPIEGIQYNYTSYQLWYYFTSNEFGEISLEMECFDHPFNKNEFQHKSIITIDGIECYLKYGVPTDRLYFTIDIRFELENSTYGIGFSRVIPSEQEQEFVEYFLDVVRPAIENRSKYLVE